MWALTDREDLEPESLLADILVRGAFLRLDWCEDREDLVVTSL